MECNFGWRMLLFPYSLSGFPGSVWLLWLGVFAEGLPLPLGALLRMMYRYQFQGEMPVIPQ